METMVDYIITKAGKRGNNKKFITAILFLILATLSSSVQAQAYYRKSLRKVQVEQQNRIYNGIVSGALTQREAAGLEYQQARIHHQIRAAQKRGYMLPGERVHIKTEQERANAYIYALKHNGQYR